MQETPVSGSNIDIDSIVPSGGTGQLIDDTSSENWYPYTINSNLDFNGHAFTDATGGNSHNWYGSLIGTGTFNVNYGYTAGYSTLLGGAAANTFTGQYNVQGTMVLDKPSGVDAVAGNLTIGNNSQQADAVQLWNNQQIDPSSVVTLDPTTSGNTSTLMLMGRYNTIAGLQSAGAGASYLENQSSASSNGLLTVSPGSGNSYNFGGTIRDGSSSGMGAMNFTMAGPGQQILSGANTYSGATSVTGGTLTVNGSQGNANISVTAGALNGNGTITFNVGNEILVGPSGTFDASGGMAWNLAGLSSSPVDLLDYTTAGSQFIAPSTLNSLLTPASAGKYTLSEVPSGSGDIVVATAVPEPGTLALLVAGLAVGFAAWRKTSVLRGGSWNDGPIYARSAVCNGYSPDVGHDFTW